MELADNGFLESFFCFPRAARNRGVSLGSAAIRAACRYASSQRSRSWRTGISRCWPPFSRNRRTRWAPWSSRSPRRSRWHRGALDGAQWPGRARVRTDGARCLNNRSHAGRQLAHVAHGRSLLGGRDRRTRRRRQVSVGSCGRGNRRRYRQRSGKAQGRRRHVNKPSKQPHWGNIPLWARQGSRTGRPQ